MHHPESWNKADLFRHIQHAIAIELWTVPLYLTALYSIKGLDTLKHHQYPSAAKLLFSVVAQEMLHLELVCNISNAVGYAPTFSPPVYNMEKGIPFIHPSDKSLPPDLHGYTVKPQALNKASLKLFCAIELPHEKSEVVLVGGNLYCSIGEFYEALKVGIVALWDECYVGDEKNTKQKNSFNEYHNAGEKSHGFSQVVNSKETALMAIDAIISQGEGADASKVPVDFQPHKYLSHDSEESFVYKGEMSHYTKFRLLLHSHHKLPTVYLNLSDNENSDAQQVLEKEFMGLLSEMQIGFSTDGESLPGSFWQKMSGFGNTLTYVWKAGACPNFDFE